jgi:gamma-glutamylcyclotransferase (GGCT)/AIG2-like uncharacterized protein YtfP
MSASQYLFAYGTLMSVAEVARMGADQRARLKREGESLGPATIAGRLYDLGPYPALVSPLGGVSGRVYGEVFRLADAGASLAWLDAYEGIVEGAPEKSEYERALRTVRIASGDELAAWVYLYRRSVAEARRLVEGRWRPTE